MMNTLFDLHGKVALITGSSHGLGFAIARGLGQAGAILVLNGRNEKRLENAISVLSDRGSTYPVMPLMSRTSNKSKKKSR